MADYYIGLSGLTAAQRAFDVIGNNIANAATEGYHRQKLELSPLFAMNPGESTFIGGVKIEGVSRTIDTFLEQEIRRQKSTLAAVSQETATLSTIEVAFAELSTEEGGLNAAIDNFFNALNDLSMYPEENIWQNQLVSEAETMTNQFRTLGKSLDSLQNQITLEAGNHTETVNALLGRIAELNQNIENIQMVSGQTNSMSDQRDQYIAELADLIDMQTINRENGVVDIAAGGIALVNGSFAAALETGYDSNAQLAIAIVGSAGYTTDIQGGKIGGLLSLHNNKIAEFSEDLDALAKAIIDQINHYHVMGTGSAGSFNQLTGRSFSTNDLSEIDGLSDGTLYIRVTDTDTGQITRHAIAVDVENDTLNDIATAISTIDGLTASVNAANKLSIVAGANYTYDFKPCVLPEPTLIDFDDPSPPTVAVSGIYTAAASDTLELLVKGDGSVGNGTLELQVRTGGGTGELIKTLNIGSGYAAGDLLDIGNGITISLSAGNLAETNGDRFCIDAFADTDTSGLLSVAGINTFFSGSSASDIAVSSAITQNSQRVATALGADGTDNANIMKMIAFKDQAVSSLGLLTCSEFYQKLISDIGQEISVKQTQQESLEVVLLNLTDRRNNISGVDINEEAAQLLVFEQMFQAMAQYMNTINTSMSSLMDIL